MRSERTASETGAAGTEDRRRSAGSLSCMCRSPSSCSTPSPPRRELRLPAAGPHLRWFAVAWGAPDIWEALSAVAQGRGASSTVARAAPWHAGRGGAGARPFFGREAISLLFVLPIALPGIITGIALRSAFDLIGSRSRSGRSCSATPPSASSWSTTTPSRGCGALAAR